MPLPPGPRRPAALQLLEWAYRPRQFLERCQARHGGAFTVRLPNVEPIVFVSEPAAIKQIFTERPEVLLAGKANRILEPLVGSHSILLLDGESHLRARRLLLPPFHGERMAAYGTLMRDITLESLGQWPLGTPFSLHPFMQKITLEVILRAVFGLEAGERMRSFAKLLMSFFTPPPYVASFFPLLRVDLPGSPFRRFLRLRALVDAALYAIIAERRAAVDAAARTDILSLLLGARDEAGRALTDLELRDELVTLLVAGHETTASALCWAFERILDTPEVEARLRAELAQPGATAEPAGVARLRYLDATIKETLRVRPILPIVVREVQVDDYEIAGHRLPRGALLAPCIFLAQRRPEAYPEPLRFWPERFLEGKPDPYAWLPFGGGIRRCVGMAFANFELAIVLATVLSSARLRRVPGEVRLVRRSVTLAPHGGARLVLDERLTSSRATRT